MAEPGTRRADEAAAYAVARLGASCHDGDHENLRAHHIPAPLVTAGDLGLRLVAGRGHARSAVIALDLVLVVWIVNSKLGISARLGWAPPRVPYLLGVGLIAMAIFLTTLLFPSLQLDPL